MLMKKVLLAFVLMSLAWVANAGNERCGPLTANYLATVQTMLAGNQMANQYIQCVESGKKNATQCVADYLGGLAPNMFNAKQSQLYNELDGLFNNLSAAGCPVQPPPLPELIPL